MKYTTLMVALLLLAACATTEEERTDPIKDFIEVSELPETDAIEVYDQPTSEAIDDKYEIVTTRRQTYLIEYTRRCSEDPFLRRVEPDVRRDARRIYAGSDTFRGCPIRKLYTMTEAQAEELREMVDGDQD